VISFGKSFQAPRRTGRGAGGAQRRGYNGNAFRHSFGYPRPQLQRREWINLNGRWDFAIDAAAGWTRPDQVRWDRTILVPFAPETPASGVRQTGFYKAVWYRTSFSGPALTGGQRLLLHCGAVDYRAAVWVNGSLVVRHEGGYTPFQADITEALRPTGVQEIVVQAQDDPHDLTQPRGKQDWQLQPHSIWYPRTTGIWQTVWAERVPATWLRYLRWTPNVERWEIGLDSRTAGRSREDLRLHVKLHAGATLLAEDTYAVIADEVHRRIALSDPGIDDSRNELLWSPAAPILIDVEAELRGPDDAVLDHVRSYTALRSVAIQGDRFVLNGRPYPLRLVLDQGYWPGTGLTAPDDAALQTDVELAKAMGFNGVRKHQKIEDPRYLYWADALGLLVWEEMPSVYRFTRISIERLTQEWTQAIRRDVSHPCIVAWVPFNESWGVPDLPESPAQRHYVQALYHLTKTLDPTRPVVGNDGWESVATDIIGIHDYDSQPQRLTRRYGKDEALPQVFKRERPGGRLLLLNEHAHTGQPVMLTEFGGIAFARAARKTWGYSRSHSRRGFAEHYTKLLAAVRQLNIFSGFCYTQFADTYQEANGLLYADRTPKFALPDICAATGGPRTGSAGRRETEWRERLMEFQRRQYMVPIADHQTVHEQR